ncbi:MAG: VWA domain-containing protein [Planctomycetota bacterium]
MIESFHFLRPAWLLALLPAGFVFWGILRRADRTRAWSGVIAPHLLRALVVSPGTRRRLRPVHLLPVPFLLGILALAGPSWEREPSPFADDTAGLFVLLEVSPSMLATDVAPDRLTRAKHKLSDLLARREGGAAGLIVYAGTAHVVMPLTRETDAITTMVEDISPDTMPREGDAFAAALERAAEAIRGSGRPGSVVVLADAVAPGQAEAVSGLETRPPVQFLAMNAPSADVDPGLAAAADALDAGVTRLTADVADVERIARRAESDIRSAVAAESSASWRDAGRTLLPLVALFLLFWARRGWVIA